MFSFLRASGESKVEDGGAIETLNVVLVGAAGSGKSTFIRSLMKSSQTVIPDKRPSQKHVQMTSLLFHHKKLINFLETPPLTYNKEANAALFAHFFETATKNLNYLNGIIFVFPYGTLQEEHFQLLETISGHLGRYFNRNTIFLITKTENLDDGILAEQLNNLTPVALKHVQSFCKSRICFSGALTRETKDMNVVQRIERRKLAFLNMLVTLPQTVLPFDYILSNEMGLQKLFSSKRIATQYLNHCRALRYPEVKEVKVEEKEFISCAVRKVKAFNVLILGRTGCGKTTLMQTLKNPGLIANTTLNHVQTTKDFERYSFYCKEFNSVINLIEPVGMGVDGDKEKFLKNMYGCYEKHLSKINAVLYLINPDLVDYANWSQYDKDIFNFYVEMFGDVMSQCGKLVISKSEYKTEQQKKLIIEQLTAKPNEESMDQWNELEKLVHLTKQTILFSGAIPRQNVNEEEQQVVKMDVETLRTALLTEIFQNTKTPYYVHYSNLKLQFFNYEEHLKGYFDSDIERVLFDGAKVQLTTEDGVVQISNGWLKIEERTKKPTRFTIKKVNEMDLELCMPPNQFVNCGSYFRGYGLGQYSSPATFTLHKVDNNKQFYLVLNNQFVCKDLRNFLVLSTMEDKKIIFHWE